MEVDKTILLIGSTGTGKTTSIEHLPLDKTVYINVDGKMMPFPANKLYKNIKLESTLQLINGMKQIENDNNIKFVVIDTLTFLADMFYKEHIEGAANTMQGWSDYKSYILEVLSIAKKSKHHYIFMAHDQAVYDEKEMQTKTYAKIQGSLKGGGIEAHFTFVIYTKVIKGTDGLPKYVFQVNKSREDIGLSAKTPRGIFPKPYTETNDITEIFNAIDIFYNED